MRLRSFLLVFFPVLLIIPETALGYIPPPPRQCIGSETQTEHEAVADGYDLVTFKCVCLRWVLKKIEKYRNVTCNGETSWMQIENVDFDHVEHYPDFNPEYDPESQCEPRMRLQDTTRHRKEHVQYWRSCYGRAPQQADACPTLTNRSTTTFTYRVDREWDWDGLYNSYYLFSTRFYTRNENVQYSYCAPYVPNGYSIVPTEDEYCTYHTIPDAGDDCAGPSV